jgi:hypothetical protein
MRALLAVSMALAILVVARTPNVAVAGQKYDYPVAVSTTYAYAGGSMGTARNSSDTNQGISCTVSGSISNTSVSCSAVDANGNSAYCYTPNSGQMAQAVAAVSSDSYIFFEWDSNGACTFVEIEASSSLAPK